MKDFTKEEFEHCYYAQDLKARLDGWINALDSDTESSFSDYVKPGRTFASLMGILIEARDGIQCLCDNTREDIEKNRAKMSKKVDDIGNGTVSITEETPPIQRRSISIYLKDDMYQKLQKHHVDTYISISKIVELALQKYL